MLHTTIAPKDDAKHKTDITVFISIRIWNWILLFMHGQPRRYIIRITLYLLVSHLRQSLGIYYQLGKANNALIFQHCMSHSNRLPHLT